MRAEQIAVQLAKFDEVSGGIARESIETVLQAGERIPVIGTAVSLIHGIYKLSKRREVQQERMCQTQPVHSAERKASAPGGGRWVRHPQRVYRHGGGLHARHR